MNLVYFLLGSILLGISIVDILWTTLWVEEGAGPLTSRLSAWTWLLIRRFGHGHPRLLTLTGPTILALGLGMWLVFLWSGWTFIFAGAENALIDTREGGALSWIEQFYFVGYSIFTLGNGSFVPRDGLWQIMTVLTTATGMLFVTLTVTYILSVLDAVSQKRSFAQSVSGLGMHGEGVVRTAWDGDSFDGLDLSLQAYISQLNDLTANHKAYPVLHYFYSSNPAHSPVRGIATLDEALSILRFGVQTEARPSKVILRNARSSVRSYLDTLEGSFIEASDETPPSPSLDAVREAKVPTVSDDAFSDSISELAERRQTLLGLIEADAREWPRPDDD